MFASKWNCNIFFSKIDILFDNFYEQFNNFLSQNRVTKVAVFVIISDGSAALVLTVARIDCSASENQDFLPETRLRLLESDFSNKTMATQVLHVLEVYATLMCSYN